MQERITFVNSRTPETNLAESDELQVLQAIRARKVQSRRLLLLHSYCIPTPPNVNVSHFFTCVSSRTRGNCGTESEELPTLRSGRAPKALLYLLVSLRFVRRYVVCVAATFLRPLPPRRRRT